MRAALLRLARDLLAVGRKRVVTLAALMFAGAALEGASLALIVPVAALVTRPERLPRAAAWAARIGLASPQAQLSAVLALFVVAVSARAAVLAWRDRAATELQLGFTDRLRIGIVEAVARARWQDLAGLRHARISHALAGEIPRAATAANLLLVAVTSLAMLAVQWLLVLVLVPGMAAVALALMVAAALAARPMLARAGAAGRSLRDGSLAMLDAAGQLMGGLKLALAQDLQGAFIAEVRRTAALLARGQRRFARSQGLVRIGSTAAAAAALAAVVLAASRQGLPTPLLIASLAVLARMFGPAMAVGRSLQQLANMLPSHAGLVELLAELGRCRAADAGADAAPLPGGAAIRLDRVCYRHPEGVGGVADLSLTIAPGELVGVTGDSGAGKTTLVDLLCGLLIPDSGAIAGGGVTLDPATLPAWRRRLAYVGQDSHLFHDSVRRNLLWGMQDVSDEALWAALEATEAAALVRAMPSGLETVVGERGGRVSGGERQRLALARALIRRPDLLLLDEATGALDGPTEARILARLAALAPRPTIVMVTHRTDALAVCDRVLTLGGGRLIADLPGPALSAIRSRSPAS